MQSNSHRPSWLGYGAARDRGASLVEYALLLALIAVACVVAVGVLGTTTGSRIDGDASSLFVREG